MASSSGNPSNPNPNQPPTTHFDMNKLFKPPPNNTTTTTTTTTPHIPPVPDPNHYPSQTAPFPPYPPQPTHFAHFQQQTQLRPTVTYPFHPIPHHGGAHLMALLGGGPPAPAATAVPTKLETVGSGGLQLFSGSSGEFVAPQGLTSSSSAPPSVLGSPTVVPQTNPARMGSAKLPKGRRLPVGDRVVYDVDVRLSGETQPTQLEVSPITKYTSDPGLVLGRQIAVNRNYICYGLRLGAIRVLDINTALRSLLRGHNQRVTDMAFFAEDVHLLASASIDGRVFVWKIDESPDEQGKPQITGKVVIAIQIELSQDSVHPRVCWHCHKQEVLVVGIGNILLKIDITKVGKGETFSADEPLKCHINKLIEGVHLMGKHDAEVTDLSMSQWMRTRLASASKDGTVKIWDDRRAIPLVILRPHDGQPVNSVAFLRAPHCPEHIVLVTAGPLNREVKIWVSSSEEGWLLASDSETWQCRQTLLLTSSVEPCVEEAFFNQVVVLPHANLILLANAKKNAIYAVHVDYGPNPSSTCMDYIAEFTVTMPILSLTGTTDYLPDGEQVVQVYCVQTQAIQQYALELALCLPSPLDSVYSSKDVSVSCGGMMPSTEVLAPPACSPGTKDSDANVGTSSKPHLSKVSEAIILNLERKHSSPILTTQPEIISTPSLPPDSSSTDVPGSSSFRSPRPSCESASLSGDVSSYKVVADQSVERRAEGVDTSMLEVSYLNNDSVDAEFRSDSNDVTIQNSTCMFSVTKNATHLVTPSKFLSGVMALRENTTDSLEQAGEARVQDIMTANGIEVAEFDDKVVQKHEGFDSHKDAADSAREKYEKALNLENLESNLEIISVCAEHTEVIVNEEEFQSMEGVGFHESTEQPSAVNDEEIQETTKDISESVLESSRVTLVVQLPSTKSKKQRAKRSQQSSSSASPFDSTDSLNENGCGSGATFSDTAASEIIAMQELLNKLIKMHKEMQKQMSATVAVPISKEGRRVETSLGRCLEKSNKSNFDALWLRIQDENAKRDKLEKDRVQQIMNDFTNYMSKELPSMLEKAFKKEFSYAITAVARAITPVIEKSISSAVAESVQRVIGDKAVNQLEKSVNSKMEVTVARQIQSQFQTSGRQALQEALRSTLEASVVPAFEQSCKSILDQVDVAFHKGMAEHMAAVQKQFESSHTPLALTLRDTINSASSFTQNLTNELAEGQRKLLALISVGQKSANSVTMQQSDDTLVALPMVEAAIDPKKELSKLISDRKYDEAFNLALQRSDVSIVSWLCSQVDLQSICSMMPLPLSQGVLLSLLQQLACDISKETTRKLGWMTDVAVVIYPTDPTIALHVHPIFNQIYHILNHQRSMPTTTPAEASSIRIILHVINSVLMSCK